MIKYNQHILRRIFYVWYLQKNSAALSRSFSNSYKVTSLQQEKATTHTSETTTSFFEKMKTDTDMAKWFHHISVKFSDVSRMGYCIFGLQ